VRKKCQDPFSDTTVRHLISTLLILLTPHVAQTITPSRLATTALVAQFNAMKTSACLVFALSALTVNAYSVPTANTPDPDSSALGRRQALGSIFGASVAFLAAPAANALDMDSFANSQVRTDVFLLGETQVTTQRVFS
jgi:hypothetical protein